MNAPASAETSPLPEALVRAAVAWSVKLDFGEPTPAQRAAFDRWLKADARHAVAWERVGRLNQRFAGLPPALGRTTLDAAEASRTQGVSKRRGALKLLSLVCVGVGTGWAVRDHAPWQRLMADVSTAAGEQRTLRLADGTELVLNVDTAVSTDFGADRRLIVLHRGEILVTTGHDSEAPVKRPFWVHTPHGRLEALGTRFTVRLADARTRVSVTDGAVALHPSNGAAPHVVRPGESRWFRADGTEPADLHGLAADSWAEGVVAGKHLRLGDVLDELARYRRGVVVVDPALRDWPVSGVFHLRDTDRALAFLTETQPVRVRYRTRFWVSVEPADQKR